MGPLDALLDMFPGGKGLKKMMDEKQMVRTEAIIQSMTPKERKNPSILDGSRRKRIARGSGTSVQDINRLLKEFKMAKKMIKQMKGKGGASALSSFLR
jgi:signal recognition particle subunit SRP54